MQSPPYIRSILLVVFNLDISLPQDPYNVASYGRGKCLFCHFVPVNNNVFLRHENWMLQLRFEIEQIKRRNKNLAASVLRESSRTESTKTC
ncbi:hypothetical protein F5890DRAFT_438318 [Lentinula detonsa]|uniref:Uncharacterized protein n=1 Tax=Lentinula detonsa TaxID=2804962 RepID=A0AA38PVH5_9AGAR|nr:hypothetical protein F5890DRAFT_438318 [Lentinula detonsa]